MKCKIYASDEGYGHLVRQQAIVNELIKMAPELSCIIQTKRNASAARGIFGDRVSIEEKFNNIVWPRMRNGTPDIDKIRAFYLDHESRSDDFIHDEPELVDVDFVLSDFVFEAFPLAAKYGIPSFGVCHFTWDWFFSKLYPVPLQTAVLDRMRAYAMSADRLYFPPFTPPDILSAYSKKAVEVPFIVRDLKSKAMGDLPADKFKVLIMDSGEGLMSNPIKNALLTLVELNGFQFYVSEKNNPIVDNITSIPEGRMFADYIPHMDLVVTRGGFNTISECIAYRTPMLLLGEPLNPEMEINMLMIKQEHLGSFISLSNFESSIADFLPRFVDGEFNEIKRLMGEHEFRCDGAKLVAEGILNYL